MTDFTKLGASELEAHRKNFQNQYESFKAKNLSLDITRGKPCGEQLDLANGMLECIDGENYVSADGIDCRNYGGLDGLSEAKKLFAEFLEVAPEETIIGGNSSLALMHDAIVRAVLHGTVDSKIHRIGCENSYPPILGRNKTMDGNQIIVEIRITSAMANGNIPR